MENDFNKGDRFHFPDISVIQSEFMSAIEHKHSTLLDKLSHDITAAAKNGKGSVTIYEHYRPLIGLDKDNLVQYLQLKGYKVVSYQPRNNRFGWIKVSWNDHKLHSIEYLRN